jgi:hypothetical protein
MLAAVRDFEAVLEAAERGPGCGIRLPFDPREVLGKARAPVSVTVDGHEAFRTTVAVYAGVGWVGLRRDQQRMFGVAVGDRVRVTVELDRAPRTVELPAELAAALAGAPAAARAYEALSYTHRKEYAQWVGEAKRVQTRELRAGKAVEMLCTGARTPG